MLAINKININNNDILYEINNNIPYEICKIIEDYTEITFTIVCKELRQFIIKVNLINVLNNKKLQQIFLDDVFNETIKLSSDGTKLVYLDDNYNISYYNISYYNINTNINKKIKLLNDGYPNNYYFDRNGLYYITSHLDTTYIFDINSNKLLHKLPIHCSLNNNIEIISKDYKKIWFRSNDNLYVYDLINGNQIYSLEINHLLFACMNSDCNLVAYYDNTIQSINILDNQNNNQYNYHFEEDYYDIKGIAFYKDLLVSLFLDHGLIVIINLKTKTKVEKEIDCFDLCNMEFTKDGKYLVVKIDDLIIETIKV